MKITMLGRKGSGKTSFLGGICDTFIYRTSHNFKIRTKRHNENMGEDIRDRRLMIGEIDKLSIRESGFANATECTTLWLLEMLHGNDKVCDFEWIDYRGGAIDDAFRLSDNVDSDEVTAHIADSDAVMIFVDSITLSYFSHDIDDAITFTGASKIYQFFETMVQEFSKQNLVILFVLSKADSNQINEELKNQNFSGLKTLCTKTFDDLVNLGRLNGWRFGIVPTGVVGENKVVTTILDEADFFGSQNTIVRQGSVSPMNIDAALFYCIKSVLENRKKETSNIKYGVEQDIVRLINTSSILKDTWNKMNGEKTSKQLAVELMRARDKETNELIKLEGVLNAFPKEKLREVVDLW